MIDFKRILFPADFSAQSRAVVPFVKAMARCFGSEIVVLHVIHVPPSAPLDTDRYRIESSVALDRFIAEEFSGTPVTPELPEGDTAQEIAGYAHDHHADLIMMPTHGHGPFRALLLGSITAKVLHDAHCPVWTGIHAEQMTSHSPDRWKRVLCAVDTEDRDGQVIKWASDFAQEQGMELQLVHAVAGADGMWTQENDPSMYDFLFHAARERLAALLEKAGTSVEIRLIGGSVGSAVHKAALEYNADLIVIGRGAIHQALGRLRSVAYSIIRAAPCPVISI
jgi:nucleotide-binding universal stress UspA family protein